VTTLRLGVMVSQIRLSSVCLSSVTFVHPTQVVEAFGNISSPFGTSSHPLNSVQNFTKIVSGEPLRQGR